MSIVVLFFITTVESEPKPVNTACYTCISHVSSNVSSSISHVSRLSGGRLSGDRLPEGKQWETARKGPGIHRVAQYCAFILDPNMYISCYVYIHVANDETTSCEQVPLDGYRLCSSSIARKKALNLFCSIRHCVQQN